MNFKNKSTDGQNTKKIIELTITILHEFHKSING